ncbi:MAG TPA: D-2-hydroxyacid dehydrogenase [Gemmatimonadaceae bacterium]|nr:D-2-hydroxyacid dehydrogenase [Gemmatimonadaceae bacterium]
MTEPRRLVVDLAASSRNWALRPEGEARLRAEAPAGWEIAIVRSPTSSDGDGPKGASEESRRLIADAEVYFGFGFTADLLHAAHRLRWVHSAAAGVGSVLASGVAASDILLTNSAGIHGPPIAEFVIAGILHFLRGLDVAIAQQRRSEWSKRFFVAEDSPLREISECRVLIVGTGGLGGESARRLAGLGATCVGVRRRPELGAPEGFTAVVGQDGLDEELPKADVLVLAAPFTADTSELMTRERLMRLPKGAIVVNVARGALLDEDAVADLLEDGRLRGAVLDVFREEPLPASSRLWSLPNALIMPHVSPVSPRRYWPRQLDLFLANWHRYDRGEPLLNLVDKTAGY